jgi:hypothetical protein
MKQTLKNIWDSINGNKTIISQFLLLILAKGLIVLPAPYGEITEWVLTGIATGSFIHHVQKGSFKTNTK